MVFVATESKLKLNQKIHWFNCLPTYTSAILAYPHSPLSHAITAITFCHSVIPHPISVALLSPHPQPLLSLECISSLSSTFQSLWTMTLTQTGTSPCLTLLCQQPLLLWSSLRSPLLPFLAFPLFLLFLIWMGLPVSYFYFSPSVFLLPTSVFLLHPRFPKPCSRSLLFPCLFQHHPPVPQKCTLPPTFSRTSNSFSASEENCQLWQYLWALSFTRTGL